MQQTLEYHRMIESLIELASSETGKTVATELQPSTCTEDVSHMLQSTAEAMDFLRLAGNLSFESVKEIRPSLQRARIGSVLSAVELLDVAGTAAAEKRVSSAFKRLEPEDAPLPILRELVGRLAETRGLAESILSSIDEDGRVKDEASPALKRIRGSIIQLQGRIRSSLEEILHHSKYVKMLQESIVTQRNDRYVIPVKQEYRGAFGGIVHDQSASGQTLFIEPQSVVDLNNRLRELELEEAREVERILGELTVQVGESAEDVENNLSVCTELDVIFAKARLGRKLKGIVPRLNTDGLIRLKGALPSAD